MGQLNTEVLTAHVPISLAEKVDQFAARLERSRGWIVKQALSDWIDKEEVTWSSICTHLVKQLFSFSRMCFSFKKINFMHAFIAPHH